MVQADVESHLEPRLCFYTVRACAGAMLLRARFEHGNSVDDVTMKLINRLAAMTFAVFFVECKKLGVRKKPETELLLLSAATLDDVTLTPQSRGIFYACLHASSISFRAYA